MYILTLKGISAVWPFWSFYGLYVLSIFCTVVCVCVCVPAAVFPVINKIDSQSVARWVFKAIQLFFGIKCWSKITVANQSMTWRHKTEQDESQAEYFKFKVRNDQLQHTDINYKLQLEPLHFGFSCAYVKIKTGTLVSSQMENNMSLKQSPRL